MFASFCKGFCKGFCTTNLRKFGRKFLLKLLAWGARAVWHIYWFYHWYLSYKGSSQRGMDTIFWDRSPKSCIKHIPETTLCTCTGKLEVNWLGWSIQNGYCTIGKIRNLRWQATLSWTWNHSVGQFRSDVGQLSCTLSCGIVNLKTWRRTSQDRRRTAVLHTVLRDREPKNVA